MKVAVMGAGAVGCYYGAMLARAGHGVVLVARPHHAEAVARNGLHIKTNSIDEFVPMSAVSGPSGVLGADVVLFCVKSSDSMTAAREMQPYLSSHSTVLSLQNGVENVDLLKSALSQSVVRTVVFVAAEMVGPGRVLHHGRGELAIGPSASSDLIAKTFSSAGIPTSVSENVLEVSWRKLIGNCSWNAISAISQLSYGQLSGFSGTTDIVREIVKECVQVARAEGIDMSDDLLASVLSASKTMPGQRSSTAQDLARGRASEIDYLNGYIVKRGRDLAIPTPVNLAMFNTVKLLEYAMIHSG
jgi:2-dehydropantoate 2-reductase